VAVPTDQDLLANSGLIGPTQVVVDIECVGVEHLGTVHRIGVPSKAGTVQST